MPTLRPMPILRERCVWRRERRPHPSGLVSLDRLSPDEEASVLEALRVLRHRYGTWRGLAKAMQMPLKTLERIIAGKGGRQVPAGLAVRTAKVAGVPVDDILSGAFPGARACPVCGRGPSHARGLP